MRNRKRVNENQPDLLPKHQCNLGPLDDDGDGICVECGQTVYADATRNEPRNARTSELAEACRHWELDCISMSCNECGLAFDIFDAKAATELARDVRNEEVLANMKTEGRE